MAVPDIDFRSFTVADIRKCLQNNGYNTDDSEFEVAENGAFKYIGYCSSIGSHRYLIGFVDDASLFGEDEMYIISRIYVDFNARLGKFVADYSGVPDKQLCTKAELDTYLEQVCN